MKKVSIWYQSAQSDWDLIMSVETDRTVTEIGYDGMGFPITQAPAMVASRMVKDLITGIILKPQGSKKWMAMVQEEFEKCWELSKDYIAQSVLKGITPRVYTIDNLIS
jgi:hypothetical protein